MGECPGTELLESLRIPLSTRLKRTFVERANKKWALFLFPMVRGPDVSGPRPRRSSAA